MNNLLFRAFLEDLNHFGTGELAQCVLADPARGRRAVFRQETPRTSKNIQFNAQLRRGTRQESWGLNVEWFFTALLWADEHAIEALIEVRDAGINEQKR
jgi:hypothetical protein